jgi:hypothetical protein
VRTVIDYSAWRPTTSELDGLNIEGVSRYLTYPDTTFNAAKQLRKPEYDHLVALGYTVTLNWEYQKSSWTKGYAVGKTHGAEARRQARALGAPDSAVIIQSIDTNPHPSQYGLAADYQRGFNDGGGCGPQGSYGTDGTIRHLHGLGLIRVGWQAMARAWHNNANDCPLAQLIQRTGHGSYDVNEVRAPHWGAVNECFSGYRCALAS